MTKKQRNRKLIQQNKRNRMINRRYTSTIKTLSKLLKSKAKTSQLEINSESTLEKKVETKNLLNNFYSIVDKAVKKGVIHKNRAGRKKSKIGALISSILRA